jgi:hypothetical protein
LSTFTRPTPKDFLVSSCFEAIQTHQFAMKTNQDRTVIRAEKIQHKGLEQLTLRFTSFPFAAPTPDSPPRSSYAAENSHLHA